MRDPYEMSAHEAVAELEPALTTDELLELAATALARGRDPSRPRPDDGRCRAHAIRGCCDAARRRSK